MRTLGLVFVTAGVIFAQAPIPAASDPASSEALRARAAELLKASQAASTRAPIQVNSLRNLPPLTPGTPSPYAAVGSAISGKCAVPLTEMATPSAADSIARTPSTTGDRIGVPSPVPSCSELAARLPAPPAPPADAPPSGPPVKAP
ncbi:MAG TPA: hypothetical protein VGN17_18255 [Bryobacteraceae bacterium]